MAGNCEFLIRRNHLEGPDIDGRVILKSLFWICLSWLRIGTDGEQLLISHTKKPLGRPRHEWEDNIKMCDLD
jgi:hypothetical protein